MRPVQSKQKQMTSIKHLITTQLRKLRQISYLVTAMVMFVAALPLLHFGQAQAAQLQFRSIQISDSSPSNGTFTSGVGSGLDVTYKVSFKTGGTATSSMVIDFCLNDPIIGDTCSAPTGMSVTGAAIDPANTGNLTSGGWSITNTNAPNPRIKLAQTSGAQLAANTQQNFNILHITNPSTIDATTKGSYYARIYTFTSTTYGTYTNAAAAAGSGFTDYGGIALSTDAVITITARVQETLTFCVSGADPNTWTTTGDCGDTAATAAPPNVVLGHGSPTAVLDTSQIDYGNIWTQLSTNATYGAVINMHSNIPCGGLSADYVPGVYTAGPPTSTTASSGTCAIPAINGGANTGPSQMTPGTAAFGVAINSYTPTTQAGPAAIGSLTPTSPYYDPAHYSYAGNVPNTASTYFGMDNTTATGFNASFPNQSSYNGAVTGAFGSTVLTSSAPVSRVDARYTFAATDSLTTPAGIYTANLSLIATGTF
jgi:hypothetical protein